MRTSRLLPVVHAGFVLTGMVTTLLGPVLPLLAARWSLDDRHAGFFFTAEFLGSIIGVGVTSLIVPRLGYMRALAVSCLLMSLGVGVLGTGSWIVGLASAAVYGLGLGVNIPATNLWISEVGGKGRAAALNLVNLAWGIGAVTLPAIVALAVRVDALRALLLGIAGASVLLALVFAAHSDEPGEMSPRTALPRPLSWGIGVALALLFFLYVGAENSVAGWVAMYTGRLHLLRGTLWAATPSIFWGALLIGRGLAVGVLRKISEPALLAYGLTAGGLGIVLLLAGRSAAPILLGTAITGLGFSSVFPLLVAKISHHFGEAAPRIAGPIFAFGGLGGASIPWLVGYTSDRVDSLRGGLSVPLTAVLLMGAILIVGGRRTAQPS